MDWMWVLIAIVVVLVVLGLFLARSRRKAGPDDAGREPDVSRAPGDAHPRGTGAAVDPAGAEANARTPGAPVPSSGGSLFDASGGPASDDRSDSGADATIAGAGFAGATAYGAGRPTHDAERDTAHGPVPAAGASADAGSAGRTGSGDDTAGFPTAEAARAPAGATGSAGSPGSPESTSGTASTAADADGATTGDFSTGSEQSSDASVPDSRAADPSGVRPDANTGAAPEPVVGVGGSASDRNGGSPGTEADSAAVSGPVTSTPAAAGSTIADGRGSVATEGGSPSTAGDPSPAAAGDRGTRPASTAGAPAGAGTAAAAGAGTGSGTSAGARAGAGPAPGTGSSNTAAGAGAFAGTAVAGGAAVVGTEDPAEPTERAAESAAVPRPRAEPDAPDQDADDDELPGRHALRDDASAQPLPEVTDEPEPIGPPLSTSSRTDRQSGGSALAALDTRLVGPAAASAPVPPGMHPGPYPNSVLAPPEGTEPPQTHRVKVHTGSRRFHTTDSPYYVRTRADLYFITEVDARGAGFIAWHEKPGAP